MYLVCLTLQYFKLFNDNCYYFVHLHNVSLCRNDLKAYEDSIYRKQFIADMKYSARIRVRLLVIS